MGTFLSTGAGAIVLLLLSILVLVGLTILRRREGLELQVRELAAFETLEQELGQATESGKPIHLALGSGSLGGGDTITSLAGLQMLEGLVDAAVSYDVPPIITVGDSTLLPLAQDMLRRAYERRQIPELYSPTNVRFVAPSSLAYAAGAIATGAPEDFTATVTVGAFGSEVSLLAEASGRRMSPQLAAVDSVQAIGALYPAVDRLAVGEELYAVGAQVTGEQRYVTSLIAQDILRVAVVAAILVGAVVALVGG
jgi:hypothetical protein